MENFIWSPRSTLSTFSKDFMQIIQQLPATDPLHPDISFAQGKKAAFVILKGSSPAALEKLQQLEESTLALFVPNDWLIIRDQMDQDWTINLPKGKGQETLYSTTFFWNAADEGKGQILDLAGEKEWAVYTEVSDKLCLLVINSKVGVDVTAEEVLGQFV